MLKAFRRWLVGGETPRTPSGQVQDVAVLAARVEEIEERLQKVDWEWGEWYEKFSTLHDRIAKRVQRARSVGAMPPGPDPTVDTAPDRVNVLAHRRPWSV